jgi:hypothetical protein
MFLFSPPPELTPAELAISSATFVFTMAVKKHQSNVLSLLMSVAPGVFISDSKIKQLRADVALLTAATIQVQQARGMRFSLERLYKIARSEEKEARRIFKKAPAPGSLATTPKDTTMVMSPVTDSDGYTTVSHRGGSSTSSPKLAPKAAPPSIQVMVMAPGGTPWRTHSSRYSSPPPQMALPTGQLPLR